MREELVVSVEHLTKKYKFGTAVENVSFELQKNHIYGLVGPNGAGKTTIMKMLGGLVVPGEGQMHFYDGGRELTHEQARKQMSFMIETPYLRKDRTARQNLEKLRILKNVDRLQVIDEVLQMVGLSDVPKGKTVRKYSLGMRQRLGIANALMTHPRCMVLDEPINGLDPAGIVEIRELLLKLNRESGVTILISSHILSELANLCTDYIFINHGRIINHISEEELMKACGGNVLLHTDQDEVAERILREELRILELERQKDQIRILNASGRLKEILKTLTDSGVTVLHLSEETQDLETYYMSLLQENGT